jgi:demethylmenaquinone methyltransferase/2-methoxy-6-polyprenyl-1,4-benzoquinol methylase
MVRADLTKEAKTVTAMFDQVAEGYDRTRFWLWLNRMGFWGKRMAAAAGARPGHLVLDVAAGTGTSTAILARSGARVVACDFSAGMLAVTQARHPDLVCVVGDAMALPFVDDSFDSVTISFGLRNVADPERALREMLRVTRLGGRLVVCEFSVPKAAVPRLLFRTHLRHVIPFIAKRLSSNPEGYRYLAESIQAWLAPDVLADTIHATGWRHVGWRPLDGGVVVVHHARATG